jgi:diguanylate cyclase (GGDEF)-like protein
MKPRSRTLVDIVRAEVGELRGEVERLAAELDDVRLHAATLEALAHEDPLTGLLNRRGFLRDLTRAIAYQARYETPAALLLGDLDRFKPINDTYGHEVGDQALQQVAQVLRQNVRASDTLGRIGGDEFALILWHVDLELARHKADLLEDTIGASPFVTETATLVLGVSLGVTQLLEHDTPGEALARADQAMYARKMDRKAVRR